MPLTEPSVPIGFAARGDLGAGCRQGSLAFNANNAFPRRASMLHARYDLLAHITAFLEVDAVQLIKQGIVRKGIAMDIVASALGHAEPDPPCTVIGFGDERAAEIGDVAHPRQQDAKPSAGSRGSAISDRSVRKSGRRHPMPPPPCEGSSLISTCARKR